MNGAPTNPMEDDTYVRRLALTITLTVGIGFLLATAARGGEYHAGTTLLCSDCHTMHYSQQHAYDGPGAPPNPPASGGPFKFLLRNRDSNVCLSCHDGQTFAPDVKGANTGSHVRLAGALTTGTAPYDNWKGHTLGVYVTPPGGAMNIKLECYNCHDPHGNANYRNLDGDVRPISYAKGTNNLTKDVFMRGWTKGDMAGNYGVSNVDFNEPDAQKSAMGKFCQGCHTDFHGAAGDSHMGGSGGVGWLRHPTGNANIGAVNDGVHSNLTTWRSHTNRVKVMDKDGKWDDTSTDLTPSCMSCHKAHGNQNPFGLIYMSGTGTVTEEGDGDNSTHVVRDLCKQCHVQGY